MAVLSLLALLAGPAAAPSTVTSRDTDRKVWNCFVIAAGSLLSKRRAALQRNARWLVCHSAEMPSNKAWHSSPQGTLKCPKLLGQKEAMPRLQAHMSWAISTLALRPGHAKTPDLTSTQHSCTSTPGVPSHSESRSHLLAQLQEQLLLIY